MEGFAFKIPYSCVIASKRNSGKTFLCNYLIKHFHDNKLFDYYVLFSQTAHISGDFGCLPDKSKFQEFTKEKLDKIFAYQEKAKNSKKPKQCLIILDDIVGAMNNDFTGLINKIFTLGRHYNISIIVLTQFLKRVITPTIRNNIDYLFFSINNYPSLDTIFEMIVYPHDKKHFINFVKNNTKEFRFIMYNNLTTDTDNFYIVKAEDTGKFFIKHK